MQYFKYTGTIFLLCGFLLLGCKKILSPVPQGQIPLDQLLTTQAGATTVLNGVYAPLMALYQGPMQRLTDLASDDGWAWRNELEPDIYVVEQGFSHSQTVWVQHYRGVTRASKLLANLQHVTDFSSNTVRDAMEGQAKFLRAFYYFNLVRLFGGVPLILDEVKDRKDAELPRADIGKVYDQIKTDLREAAQLLPATYSGGNGQEAGRPTSYAARALLAMVHLELREWGDAAREAAEVIGKGAVADNYAANFNGSAENGAGALFEVQYGGVAGETTSSISTFFAPRETPSGSAIILPTDNLLNGKGGGPSSGNGIVQAIQAEDRRRSVIMAGYGLPNFIDASRPAGSLQYVNKYFNEKDPAGMSTWNFPLIRYAEVLLVRAEALNEDGFVPDGEAFNLLNASRLKAGLPALTAATVADQAAFRAAVAQERRVELSFECKRYFDLNRRGLLKAAIQPQLDYLQLQFPDQKTIAHPVTGNNYYLYPLPATEFINNANLGSQNPGYF
ncbi:RagB/SusD family nutrient uptake outer membrane protein [Chitinophaga alhagiae]|uniref:RagB/SusD family nutrient uptake outer membrane protein n=1 Tax=Chitinophaga alhagiae TaxID=2203219 RepID=UPI000E5C0505|nr:RagB/SusD family nutrient uptake outer membrane protein [Chitinophaga alhagiae]